MLCGRCTVLGPQTRCVICNLHNSAVKWALLCRVCLAQMTLTLIMHLPLAALQVLAVSTHNHYRRVQDRMRKKQQQEARETAAANAVKMQAPAGPSGQAQVGCTSLMAT